MPNAKARPRLVRVPRLRLAAVTQKVTGRWKRPTTLFFVGVALLTLWVWQRAIVIKKVSDVGELRERVTQLERMHGDLLARATELSARPRIEQIAADALGLEPTPNKRIRVVGAEHSSADRVKTEATGDAGGSPGAD